MVMKNSIHKFAFCLWIAKEHHVSSAVIRVIPRESRHTFCKFRWHSLRKPL